MNDESRRPKKVYEADCGFVFAATGDQYTTMARRSARNLKRACPDFPIDLYTDQNIQDDVFEQIHQLSVSDRRPKMESLLRSRFNKTVFLDADTITVADISDLFDRLDTYEFTAAHATQRNRQKQIQKHMADIPASFPEYNSGVLGVRKTHKIMRVLQQWESEYKAVGTGMDQPHLRRALYDEEPLIWVLPREFNLISQRYQERWRAIDGPIRILHLRQLQKIDLGSPDRPFYIDEVLGPKLARHLLQMIKSDSYLPVDRAEKNVSCLATDGYFFQPPQDDKTNLSKKQRRWKTLVCKCKNAARRLRRRVIAED